MEEKDLLVKFWKRESATTRKVMARIPEGSDYRPDPKSRPAREIAWQIVHEERTLIDGLEKGRLEWTEAPAPAGMKDVLAAYDKHLEIGVLCRGGQVAAQVQKHFDNLIATGVLRLVP